MEHLQPDGGKQKQLQSPLYAPERAAKTPIIIVAKDKDKDIMIVIKVASLA